jgi:acyl-CoA thioesterase
VPEQALAEACGEWMYSQDHAARSLGVSLDEIAPGFARMSLCVRPDMLNSHALCHGGAIFTLADCAFAYAGNSRNQVTVASGCVIDYVRPAREGERLTAEAHERSLTGRTGLYDVTVQNQDGEVIAHMRGRSHRVSGAVLPESRATAGPASTA